MWSVWLVFCDCGFHPVCPLTDKAERLVEASWWEGLAVGKSGSCSDVCVGGAMLSKSLIQFSVGLGWGHVASLLFGLRPNYNRGNGHNVLLQKDLCQHCCIQCPWPQGSRCQPTPLLETSEHSQASLAQSLVGSLLLSPVSWCTQGFVSSNSLVPQTVLGF